MPRRPETTGCAASQPHFRRDIQRERLEYLRREDERRNSPAWRQWHEMLEAHYREQMGQLTLFGPHFPDLV